MNPTTDGATNPTPPGPERRASIRYPSSVESFSPESYCRPVAAAFLEDTWQAIVRDFSTGGIGLVVNRRFEPGTVLAVDLQDSEQTTRSTLLVRVVRVTEQGPDFWLLGCAFTRKLTDAELLTLM